MPSSQPLPKEVEEALIKDTLRGIESLILEHGLSEVLVGLAMYCSMQAKAKLGKSEASDRDVEVGYYFRDAAKALEIAASLTYRTQD
jgi:hypothetical protein